MAEVEEVLPEVEIDPATMAPIDDDGIVVEMPDAPQEIVDMASTEESATEPESDFDENLAEGMSESDLGAMATELLQLYDEDKRSREPWERMFERGLILLGMTDDVGRAKPFPGASTATHPVLAEALVQFNSRAITELFPPMGPVKGKPAGKITPQIEDQRDRVETHMNYQYIEEMPEAFSEMDKLTYRLGFEGTSFKKLFFDRLLGRHRAIYVSGRDIIVPYESQGLEQAPRVSHRYAVTHNTLLMRQKAGEWREIEVAEPEPTSQIDGVDEAIANSEGREPTGMGTGEHEIIEMQVYYNLKGHEDVDGFGVPTGIGLPYVVTMEQEGQTVLAIRRDWRERDMMRRRRNHLAMYGYVPGFGFYYQGLVHLIGGLAEATTGTVRALLDSAQFAAMQGGFKSKEARPSKGSVTMEPGVWKDVDLTGDELAKAFYTPPSKEPPTVLFQLLGALTEYARRFASTTEAMVGDANNNGPVGTTLALIEQGMKVFSAIHKRMHVAQMAEFRILAQLNAEHLPTEPRPVTWNGGTIEISAADYDGRVDVIPVSDPNMFSQTQRIALAQGVYQLAGTSQNIDKREAEKMMLSAMGLDNDRIKKLMPDPEDQLVPLDPVTENQLITMGKPVRAFPHQNHDAHMAVHRGYLQMLPPDLQEQAAPVFQAHIVEHVAHAFRVQIESQMDQVAPELSNFLPRPNYHAKPGDPYAPPSNPQADDAIASAVAQWMAGNAPQEQPQQDPEAMKAQAEIARKDAAAEAEQKRKDLAAAREIARTDEKFKQELEIKDATAAHKTLQEMERPRRRTLTVGGSR